VELGQHLMLYIKLRELANLYLVPPLKAGDSWKTVGEGVKVMDSSGAPPDGLQQFMTCSTLTARASRANSTRPLTDYRSVLDQRPLRPGKVDYEAFFNRFDPFTLCMYFYIVVFLFAIGSWLLWQRPLAKTAFWVLVLAMVIHTFGLISACIFRGGRR